MLSFVQFAALVRLTGGDRPAAVLWYLIDTVGGARKRRIPLLDIARALQLSERTARRTVSHLESLNLVNRKRSRKASGRLGSYDVALSSAAVAFAAALKTTTQPAANLAGGEQAEMVLTTGAAGAFTPAASLTARIREDKRTITNVMGEGANAPLTNQEISLASQWLADLPEAERFRRIQLLNTRITGYPDVIADRTRFLLAALEKDRHVFRVKSAECAAEVDQAAARVAARGQLKDKHLALESRALQMREDALALATFETRERLRAARLRKFEELVAAGLDAESAYDSVEALFHG